MIGRPNAAANPGQDSPDAEPRPGWTLLSNHGHVLACIAKDPEARVREIADRVGITERAVQRILGDLDEAGVITRTRTGRRSRYSIDAEAPLRHTIESHRTVGELLAIVAEAPRGSGKG